MKVITGQLAAAAVMFLSSSLVLGEQWTINNAELAVLTGRTAEFKKR